jgi:hypothetical protein
MDEEILKTGPSVRRFIEREIAEALTRNGVYAASGLSDDVRSRAATRARAGRRLRFRASEMSAGAGGSVFLRATPSQRDRTRLRDRARL